MEVLTETDDDRSRSGMMLLSSTSEGCESIGGGIDESLFCSGLPPIPVPAPVSRTTLEGVDAAHPIVLFCTLLLSFSFCWVAGIHSTDSQVM